MASQQAGHWTALGLVVGMAGGLATYVFTGRSEQNMFVPFATEQVTIVRLLIGGLAGGVARRRPLGHAWWIAALVFGLAVVALLVADVLSDVIGVKAVATVAEFGLVGELAGMLAQLIHRRSPGCACWVGALIGVLVFELTTGLIGANHGTFSVLMTAGRVCTTLITVLWKFQILSE